MPLNRLGPSYLKVPQLQNEQVCTLRSSPKAMLLIPS